MEENIKEAQMIACEHYPRFDGRCDYADRPDRCPVQKAVREIPELVCIILNLYYSDWEESKIPERVKKKCMRPWLG